MNTLNESEALAVKGTKAMILREFDQANKARPTEQELERLAIERLRAIHKKAP